MTDRRKRRGRRAGGSRDEVRSFLRAELRRPDTGEVVLSEEIAVEPLGPFIVHPSLRSVEEVSAAADGTASSFGVSHAPTGLLVATLPDFVIASWVAGQLREREVQPGALWSSDPNYVTFAGFPPFADYYLSYVEIEAMEPGAKVSDLLDYDTWLELNRPELMREANPMSPRAKAAAYAALGGLVGGVGGALVGYIGGGLIGVAVGAISGGGSAAMGGGILGGVLGMPVGGIIGTIFGAVKGADYVYPGEEGRPARLGAGVGSAIWPVVGAAAGAAIFAPEDRFAANPERDDEDVDDALLSAALVHPAFPSPTVRDFVGAHGEGVYRELRRRGLIETHGGRVVPSTSGRRRAMRLHREMEAMQAGGAFA